MKQVILYNKVTGKIIYSSLTTNARMLEKTLSRDSNLAYIEGSVAQNKYQVNVSVDPHFIEEKPPVTIYVPGWIRDKRHNLLKGTDWTVGADSPLSDSKKAEWQTYRQALRDLPDTYADETDIENVIWPTEPS
jgi:hypothetical protein